MLWLALAVGVACLALWHWNTRRGPPAGETQELLPSADRRHQTQVPIASPAIDSRADKAEAGPVEALDTLALRRLCGRPWVAEFTAECLAILERRYQDSVPDPLPMKRKFRPVMLGEPVTWGEVFDGVVAGLAAVEDALDRPECLVPEGRFRLDLGDACAANDIARLAILRRECVHLLPHDGSLEGRRLSWDAHMRTVDRAADQAEYYRRLEQLDERWFGMMWRLGKCRAVPKAALGDLGPFLRPLGPGNFDMDQIDMMEAAARLGSNWALSSVLHMRGNVLVVGDQGIDDVRGQRPVLAELLRARRAEGVERVKHALVAFELGEALGIPVQSVGLSRLTGYVDYEQQLAAWPPAARRLIALGWTLVVDDSHGGEPRRFETPEDVFGDEPWPEWAASGWLRLVPATEPSPQP